MNVPTTAPNTNKIEIITNIFDDGNAVKRYERLAHDYITANFMQHGLNVEDIAGRLGINRQYLSRLFKKVTGISPNDYRKAAYSMSKR